MVEARRIFDVAELRVRVRAPGFEAARGLKHREQRAEAKSENPAARELQQVVDKIASPSERILALVKQAIEIKDVQKKGL